MAAKTQCSGTLHTITYDTTVSGIGSTGANPYNFTFPRFDGTLGTLVNVNVTTVATLSYQYDIENMLSARTHQFLINRFDDVFSPALMTPLTYDTSTARRYFPLGSADGNAGSGSDFASVAPFYILDDDTIISANIANTADYIGLGNVSFEYSTSMIYSVSSGAQITNDIAQDEVTFILSYTYCDNIMLASDITSFTATRDATSVALRWLVADEAEGRRYEVQKSTDG